MTDQPTNPQLHDIADAIGRGRVVFFGSDRIGTLVLWALPKANPLHIKRVVHSELVRLGFIGMVLSTCKFLHRDEKPLLEIEWAVKKDPRPKLRKPRPVHKHRYRYA